MSGMQPILEALVDDGARGRPAALCVVLRTRGSTPQAAGAAMLVRSDMGTVGTLGGGCVEAEVRRRAFELLRQSRSELLEFTLDHDYGWDDGLICGGRMSIGVVSIVSRPQLAPFQAALGDVRRRAATRLPILLDDAGRQQRFHLRVDAPPTLVIAGAGHVGRAVAMLAVEVGFHVVVIDDRADIATAAHFPPPVERIVDDIAAALRRQALDEGTYVVIVTRGHQHDHQALDAVVRRPARYIGMIGSRRKSHLILRGLAEAGVPQEQLARVHTPIGLPIGALTVPEIAVSIVAELVQVRRSSATALVEGPFEPAAQDGVSEARAES